jgi:hypothetical protein
MGFKYQKGYDWLDLNPKQEGGTIGGVQISEGLRLVGFEFEARRGTIGGIQISDGLRLVGFTIPLFVPRNLFTTSGSGDVISGDATSGNVISGDVTSGDVTAPHCSTSNDKWMVPLYYFHCTVKLSSSPTFRYTLTPLHIYDHSLPRLGIDTLVKITNVTGLN